MPEWTPVGIKHASPIPNHEARTSRLTSPVFWRIAEGASLGLVLALAGVLRLGWPGYNAFLYDEARVSLLALQMAHGTFISVGMPSSTALPNMPGLVWLMTPLFWLSSDPLFATLAIGLANTLAVAGVWWLARRAWGSWAALCAALLLAGSPWSVFYSRSIWGQDLLVPLTVIWALGAYGASRPVLSNVQPDPNLHRITSRRPDFSIFGCIFVAFFAPQVHYAGLALIPATVLMGLRFKWWRRWKAGLAGFTLAALCALPFALAVLRDPGLRSAFRTMLQAQTQYNLTSLYNWAEVGLGLRWEWLLLSPNWAWPQPLGGLLRGAQIVVGTLGGLGLGVLAYQTWWYRQFWNTRLATLGFILALVPPLLFLRHNTPVYQHYQLVVLPALFLGAGALAGAGSWRSRASGVPAFPSWLRQVWGPAITLLALGAALVQAVALGQGIYLMGQSSPPGGLGTPLHYPRAAIQALKVRAAALGGAEIIVSTPGDDPAFLGDAAIFETLLWGTPHRIVDGNSVLLIPGSSEAKTILLSIYPAQAALDEARMAGIVSAEQPLPRRKGELPYISWQAAGAPQGFHTITPQTLANGAVLVGYRVRRAGDKLRLSTLWQLTRSMVTEDYHQFNHLYSTDGQTKLEGQDRPLSTHAWKAGDTLITWADFTLPQEPGVIWFDVGMYAYPSMDRVAVQDPANTTASIRLGPVESWD
ncbi:MAG: hypothetical protein ACYCZF_06300 [Anaerolineae bacterium]